MRSRTLLAVSLSAIIQLVGGKAVAAEYVDETTDAEAVTAYGSRLDSFQSSTWFNFYSHYGAGTSSGRGATDTSQSREVITEAKEDGCDASSVSPLTSRPVDITSGNKLLFEEDFSTPPLDGVALEMRRTYNKSLGNAGIFGTKWSSSVEYTLTFEKAGVMCSGRLYSVAACSFSGEPTKIHAHRASGYASSFEKGADGVWRNAAGSILEVSGGGWKLTGPSGGWQQYDQYGRPTAVRDERRFRLLGDSTV